MYFLFAENRVEYMKLVSADEITVRRKYEIHEPNGAESKKGDKLMLPVKVAWIHLKHEFMLYVIKFGYQRPQVASSNWVCNFYTNALHTDEHAWKFIYMLVQRRVYLQNMRNSKKVGYVLELISFISEKHRNANTQ
jgi:hypothetical protein